MACRLSARDCCRRSEYLASCQQVPTKGAMKVNLISVHRQVLALVLVVVFVVLTAGPAAAGGTVSCGGAGQLYTFGKSTVSQYHWVDDLGSTGDLGAGSWQVYWGLRSGSYQWDVYGTGVYYESAHCPI